MQKKGKQGTNVNEEKKIEKSHIATTTTTTGSLEAEREVILVKG
jgi:hypothetical protein